MIPILSLIILYIYNNNSLLKIKSYDETKTIWELASIIKSKKNRKKIKKVLISENTNKIITYIESENESENDDANTNTTTNVKITKTNSNEKMNIYIIDQCISYGINYDIVNNIQHDFIDLIIDDFTFFLNKILFPYLYFTIIFNVLNIGNKAFEMYSNDTEYSDIMISSFGDKNTSLSNSLLSNSSALSKNMIVQKDSRFMFFRPNVSLSNWVGSPEIFEECYEIISYQINNTNYKNLGAILPKGILLEGPPGVGKTYLAKAIATETKSSFISISGSEFIEMYVGVGASRVRELFKLARTNSPSIIFIDEIDAIGRKRSGVAKNGGDSNGGSTREHDQTLNQLLTEMDGFKDNSEIIVLAATNRKDTLDSALLRPGRFDRHIHISLPDKYSRLKILKLYLEEKKKKDAKINITTIAELTDGFSGADLKNLINEGAILAARRGAKKITATDITNALEKLVVGLERKNDDRSIEVKYRIGIHEVGHGFLTIYFNEYFDLQKISIKSTYNGAGGYTLMTEKSQYKNGGLYTKDLLFKKIIILLGGKAAESIWFGSEQVSLGATQDLKQSNQLVRKMVEMFGMGTGELETFYNHNLGNDYYTSSGLSSTHSEKIKEQIDMEILGIISNAYKQAKEILELNKVICDELVEKLLLNEILYRKDTDLFFDDIKNKIVMK